MRGRGSPTGFIELPTNYSHFARIPTIPPLFYPQKTSPRPSRFWTDSDRFFRPGFPLSGPITPPPIRLPAPPRRPPRSGPQHFPDSFTLLRILPNAPPILAQNPRFSLQYFGNTPPAEIPVFPSTSPVFSRQENRTTTAEKPHFHHRTTAFPRYRYSKHNAKPTNVQGTTNAKTMQIRSVPVPKFSNVPTSDKQHPHAIPFLTPFSPP